MHVSATIYGYVHACKHCKPWVNSDACQFCIAHQPWTWWHGQSHAYMSTCMHVSNTCGLRLSTIKIAKSAMSTIASIHMYTRQHPSSNVRVYIYKVTSKRPCILCCVDNQQIVWYMRACGIYVSAYMSVCMLLTFTKLCDQKAQWVSTIASTDTYMHVSRPSNCVYM